MFKTLLITAGLLAATMTLAGQNNKILIPAGRTAPNDGKEMYMGYCASCHGVDGKGHGPAATALSPQPTDLTLLSRSNHGKYPDTHVVAILQFGLDVPAHGSATMPVWGPILGNMNRANLQEKQLRISNLAQYLEKIQEP